MSKSSLMSPGVAISVHPSVYVRVPRMVLSGSSRSSVHRAGAACLNLFVVLGRVGMLRVDEVGPDLGFLRLLFRDGKPAVRGGVVPRR
jgi:hypothetical protein